MRWLRKHGRLIDHTIRAEDAALDSTSNLKDVVYSLWNSHALSNNAIQPKPAVVPAVQLLTSPEKASQPSISQEKRLLSDISHVTSQSAQASAAKPVSSQGCVSPSITDQLAVATRNCIRESQIHLGSLRVLSWRAGAADVCVTVGIPTMWSADVSLDSLDPESARFRVHSLTIHVANNPDSTLPTATSRPSDSQIAMLRRMADDRMLAAVKASTALSSHNSVNAACVMLCALRDMMIYDVCAPLAMDYLRAQTQALANGPWKSFINVSGAAPDTPRSEPLVVRYWVKHRQSASITLTQVQQPARRTTSHADSPQSIMLHPDTDTASSDRPPVCVVSTHQPSLPGMVQLGCTPPNLVLQHDSLDIEQLLLSSIRVRTRGTLYGLTQHFIKKHRQLRIDPACVVLSNIKGNSGEVQPKNTATHEDVLTVQFGKHGETGMLVTVSTMTGGLRIRPYGAAALPLPVQRGRDADLWDGARNFESDAAETMAVVKAFEAVRARVKLNASARSVCALDIGVSNTLPPGTASVAATASPDRAASQLVPPFAPLERRAPRRFLTLSPPPPPKDALRWQSGGASNSKRSSSARGTDRGGPSKRPRLTYATTSDALVFIQESTIPGEEWRVSARESDSSMTKAQSSSETENVDRYSGTAAATATWAITREVVERRLRRDSLLRAFVGTHVASAAQTHHSKASDDSDLHLDSASKVLLKVKCEPLPVRKAELLLRGYDAWQVRLHLLPAIFDGTDPLPHADAEDGNSSPNARKKSSSAGNIWSVGVCCRGSQLTFTYPSANAISVRSFFRDLTRARTAAALARGVPPSRFYRVLRRSPVRIVVGIGPYGKAQLQSNQPGKPHPKPDYTATVEYVYSKGNSGGFSLSFSPSTETMELLAPLIEEALDASGGQVGGILAGLLERACPVAAAAESAVRRRKGRIRFVTALRVRAVFTNTPRRTSKPGQQGQDQNAHPTSSVVHAVDVDARSGGGRVTVIDVGRATAVMVQHGLAHRTGSSNGSSRTRNDFVALPHWDEKVAELTRNGYADAQRAGSTVVLRMEMLETFLKDLVSSVRVSDET